MPAGAKGIVLFAHGSGSSRLSARNRFVARQLTDGGFLATLLLDLLTPAEEESDRSSGHLRFDVRLLAERLRRATDFVRGHSDTRPLAVGFGASTGAAAALIAAADRPDVVRAEASRGGRPDLAEDALECVAAPTLLIVGSADHPVVELNARAHQRLLCQKRIEVVVGATHLFEEPGALEEVARLARDWFVEFLVHRLGAPPLLEPPESPGP